MTIAVISDIHANLEALEVVLEDIDRRGINEILCCGDIVGYGPNPNECIALARKHVAASVLGNHDLASAFPGQVLGSGQVWRGYARESFLWTNKQLSEEEKAYLLGLPYVKFFDDFILSHGSAVPDEQESFKYISLTQECRDRNIEYLEQEGKHVLYYGHDHQQGLYTPGQKGQPTGIVKLDDNLMVEMDVVLKQGSYHLINVGSVGQPRDRDRRACYVVHDEGLLKVIRLEYDFRKTMQKIQEAGLPEILAQRLELGR